MELCILDYELVDSVEWLVVHKAEQERHCRPSPHQTRLQATEIPGTLTPHNPQTSCSTLHSTCLLINLKLHLL